MPKAFIFFLMMLRHLIAKKALRVNLSDLAAKGAKPTGFLVSLGLGESWDEEWLSGFSDGLAEDCEAFGISLLGGDTFKTGGGFVISITALGEHQEGQYVSRLGGKEGDLLFTTGTIGDAALGLLSRKGELSKVSNEHRNHLVQRYLLPQPRVGFATFIPKFATASMDISDGLVGDLEKLCNASGLGAEIHLNDVPLSRAAEAAIELESNLLNVAVTGGDDYEILFSVSPDNLAELNVAAEALDYPVTCIGVLNGGKGVKVFDRDGKVVEFDRTSYDHSGESC